MINVTRTFLPPIGEYMTQVQRAYENVWLTNRGELIRELEQKIQRVLQLDETAILCMNNGTIPLQIALKLLARGGHVITTPFSYVATTSSILWEGCKPVFVDINSEYLTIDETKIEEAITPRTTCILATHVFGNPCNVQEIQRVADKYELKVIYDAAHCFGVDYLGKSIFEYGDVSTCSFHATKLFHTGEGGAVFCKDPILFQKVFYTHNFGHNGPTDFHGLGINAKISELQAAMGLAVLPYLQEIISQRKRIVEYYDEKLDFKRISKLNIRSNTTWNYSYYPILFSNEETLLKVEMELRRNEISGRRYFYPSLNTLNFIEANSCPVSEDISKRIFCLPLYPELKEEQLDTIVEIVQRCL